MSLSKGCRTNVISEAFFFLHRSICFVKIYNEGKKLGNLCIRHFLIQFSYSMHKLNTIALLSSVATLVSCLSDPPLQQLTRLYGGSTVANNTHDFVADIVSVDPQYSGKKCSGTLITDGLVLTTANCLMTAGYTWFNTALMTVTFGDAHQTAVYKVKETMITDGYQKAKFHHNIGLIFLGSPVPSSVAKPIKMYPGHIGKFMSPIFAIGYGQTANSGPRGVVDPHVLEMSLLPDGRCSAYKNFDPSTQICANGNKQGGLCDGDEGAPLVSKQKDENWMLLGVASYSGIKSNSSTLVCGTEPTITYFEKVGAWTQWISKWANVPYNEITVKVDQNELTSGDKESSVDEGAVDNSESLSSSTANTRYYKNKPTIGMLLVVVVSVMLF